MLPELIVIFRRELGSWQEEVKLFPDDASLWATVPGLPNSAGTLTIHVCGALRHFVGMVLGNSGYVRNRDAEFSRRNESRAALVEELRVTSDEVATALANLDPGRLTADFPMLVGKGVQTTTQQFLLHHVAHMAYHLGQVDYARRAVTGDATSAGTLPMPPLAVSSSH